MGSGLDSFVELYVEIDDSALVKCPTCVSFEAEINYIEWLQ